MVGQTTDDGPDMENRDPNDLNSHVKVNITPSIKNNLILELNFNNYSTKHPMRGIEQETPEKAVPV